MCAKRLKEGPDPTALAAHLESTCVRKANGSIAFPGFSYGEWANVLRSSIRIADDYPTALRHHAVQRAVLNAAHAGAIAFDGILAELTRIERNYRRRNAKPFVLLTSVSLQYGSHLRTIRTDGCTLTFTRLPPRPFDLSSLDDRLKRLFAHRPVPGDYTAVRIHTRAKSEPEAQFKASSALDLLRAIWNLRLNHGRTRLWAAGRPRPVNSILLGPYSTLHHPNGTLATDAVWYDQTYCSPAKAENLANRWGDVCGFADAVRKSLSKVQYAQDLKRGFLDYVRAMDGVDHEVAAIRAWSALEHLTGTARMTYDTTVKRASYVMRDPVFNRRTLQHLRLYRNRAVHKGADDPEGEQILYQVKRYVEAMLMWHLRFAGEFKAWEEAMRFLDSPVDPRESARRAEILDLAATFRA